MSLPTESPLPTLLEALEFMASRALGAFEREAHDRFGAKGAELLAGLASHGFAVERPNEARQTEGRYYAMTEAGHRRLRAKEALEADADA